MARSTPTYTPIRNYAIGFFLSALLLFSDINYGYFSQVRGIFKATTLYVQIFSGGVIETIGNTYSSFQDSKNLLKENLPKVIIISGFINSTCLSKYFLH